MQVVSDMIDSHKWIILSLKRLVHWKVRTFQSLQFDIEASRKHKEQMECEGADPKKAKSERNRAFK